MGTAIEPDRVKLFLAVMYTKKTDMENALSDCTAKYGDIENECGPFQVGRFTKYYDTEMRSTIKKKYFVFKTLIDRDDIASIKTFTNTVEQRFSKNDRRQINLDPGYIANDKFVLVTTKDFYHRIYLNEGIYGEVTLHYRKGRFRYFSWTYPDYKDKDIQSFLENARVHLVSELNKKEKK